jgi:hypothetical protein
VILNLEISIGLPITDVSTPDLGPDGITEVGGTQEGVNKESSAAKALLALIASSSQRVNQRPVAQIPELDNRVGVMNA